MPQASVTTGSYGGLESIVLTAGGYRAELLPGMGAQLVSLRVPSGGLRLLREPLPERGGDLAHYLRDPVPYGLPLLLPPNRIGDGTFTFGGHTYRFPINEPELHNRLHGFFARARWAVAASAAEGGSARVVLRHTLREDDEVFQFFPHRLTLTLAYTLSAAGLDQEVAVANDGPRPMPLLVGFHTALRVPFAPDGGPGACSVSVNIGRQWELSARKLPTGRTVPRDAMAEAIAGGGGDPFAHPIDALFSTAPGPGPNRCVVRDRRLGVNLVYETDRRYRAWMLWNADAAGGFFCPEPMTCLVNAPNLDLPAEETGMLALPPGARWSAVSRLRLDPAPGQPAGRP